MTFMAVCACARERGAASSNGSKDRMENKGGEGVKG